jgi:hypothetical protein
MRSVLKTVSVLIALASGVALLRSPAESQGRSDIIIRVPDVPGPYCVYGVEKRLLELPEVATVRMLWEADEIRVALKEGAVVSRERIEDAIERAEYPYPYEIQL